ncbi:hypothetical protein [Bradyrhizobium sp. RDI18]|uniref:hypothetical protein n=1 Tax=Bradyrhizobium sp. RDI18 TaxID=3367400 RepID=UPI00371A79F9
MTRAVLKYLEIKNVYRELVCGGGQALFPRAATPLIADARPKCTRPEKAPSLPNRTAKDSRLWVFQGFKRLPLLDPLPIAPIIKAKIRNSGGNQILENADP